MDIKAIYNVIDLIAPFSEAEEWDNSGILVDSGKDIKKALFCLDCSLEVVKEAIEKKVDLIVSHHPLIFDPIKKIESGSPLSLLIKNEISLISAHTNLDKSGISVSTAEKLGLTDISSDGFLILGNTEKISARKLAEKCREVLGCPNVRYTEKEDIEKVAFVSGSGGSFLSEAIEKGADALITGDIKHDVFIEANNKGIALIDAGHYSTEKIFISRFAKKVGEKADIEIILSEKEEIPFKKI